MFLFQVCWSKVATSLFVTKITAPDASLPYQPPDLNPNITQIFAKLINIYRGKFNHCTNYYESWFLMCLNFSALGDDRRSFSYYKAIPVIESLPFKIQSVDQVKELPAIGKSMQDHVSIDYSLDFYD